MTTNTTHATRDILDDATDPDGSTAQFHADVLALASDLAAALRKVLDTAVWDDEFCSKADYVAATEPAEAVYARARELGVAP